MINVVIGGGSSSGISAVVTGSAYVIIHFVNDAGNQFFFKGGQILLSRCTSGCGM